MRSNKRRAAENGRKPHFSINEEKAKSIEDYVERVPLGLESELKTQRQRFNKSRMI
jgi:hypothetical protein